MRRLCTYVATWVLAVGRTSHGWYSASQCPTSCTRVRPRFHTASGSYPRPLKGEYAPGNVRQDMMMPSKTGPLPSCERRQEHRADPYLLRALAAASPREVQFQNMGCTQAVSHAALLGRWAGAKTHDVGSIVVPRKRGLPVREARGFLQVHVQHCAVMPCAKASAKLSEFIPM